MNFKPIEFESSMMNHKIEIMRQAELQGLVLLKTKKKLSKDAWRDFCKPFGDFLLWDFGDVNELLIKEDSKNYLYSPEAVPMHWDGAFKAPPRWLMFYCAKSKGNGGETLFTDTQSVLSSIDANDLDIMKNITLHYQTEKIVHYGGNFSCKMISKHPKTNDTVIRYAEPVETKLNPVSLSIEGLPKDEEAAFINFIRDKLYHPKHCYTHEWEEGDIIIADNHRLLHGRNKIESNVSRHILRIQIK